VEEESVEAEEESVEAEEERQVPVQKIEPPTRAMQQYLRKIGHRPVPGTNRAECIHLNGVYPLFLGHFLLGIWGIIELKFILRFFRRC